MGKQLHEQSLGRLPCHDASVPIPLSEGAIAGFQRLQAVEGHCLALEALADSQPEEHPGVQLGRLRGVHETDQSHTVGPQKDAFCEGARRYLG